MQRNLLLCRSVITTACSLLLVQAATAYECGDRSEGFKQQLQGIYGKGMYGAIFRFDGGRTTGKIFKLADGTTIKEPVFYQKPMQYQVLDYRNANGEKVSNVLRGVGGVGNNEADNLRAWIRRVKAMPGGLLEVQFHSSGGNADQGILMARVLHEERVQVHLLRDMVCFSACTYAFLGGVNRIMDEGSYYGIHMFSGAALYTEHVQLMQQDVEYYKSFEQGNAQHAGKLAKLVADMGVSDQVAKENFDTPNSGASCPPPGVLRKWNVVN